MSRVERTETPNSRRASEPRQAERGRSANTPTPTPTKAEGEVRDVEQALKNQNDR